MDMLLKTDIYTAGKKCWIRVVDQHTGISREVDCHIDDRDFVKAQLKNWVKLKVAKQANKEV
jgi:hypothetical protein